MLAKKNPTVKGRWEVDLMFSQRNNPYCDLLKICCKCTKFFGEIQIFSCFFCTFVDNLIIEHNKSVI